MARKVMIAVDGSKHCERAIQWYADNLNSSEDQLLFVFVVEPPAVSLGTGFVAGPASGEMYAASVSEAIHSGKKLAAHLKEVCAARGLKQQTRFLERMMSGAGPALVEVANEEEVSLIVMGNRGMSTLRRTFMGSVSDYVLHHAHRPIIIVPPPK